MGWGNSLALVGLAFVLIVGVLLYVEARRQNKQFVHYKDVAQPGCFQVGKDLKS